MTCQRHMLANGLRVVLGPAPEATSVTVLIMVAAGSKYETKAQSGLSHFLEHMCFKGTTRRPTPLQIASELDSLGAAYNAFTAQEYTGYFATVAPPHLEQVIDIIADMYLRPTFPAEEIEKEKGVIVEEINMYEDMPQHQAQDLFQSLLYGDQPAGWNIAGTKETVRSLRREDFLNYRSRHYLPQATVCVVTGNVSPTELLPKLERQFSTLAQGDKGLKLPVQERQAAPQLKQKEKISDQTHLVLGFRSAGLSSPDEYALEVLAAALGGGMSSRLFRRIREELGAAYYVRAAQEAFTDHGYLAVSAGVTHALLLPVIRAVLEECRRVIDEPVPETELRRVKDSLIGHLYLGLETTSARANFFGFQELLKTELLSPDEIKAKIEQVTAAELQSLAGRTCRAASLNLALVGPLAGAAAPDQIAKSLHL